MEKPKKIWLTDDAVCIEMADGRVGKELFADYSRLKYATPEQRSAYEVSSIGIHWRELDEDLSFEGFFRDKTPKNDVAKVFSGLQEVNISAFARRMNISQSVMGAYLCGAKQPSRARKKQIEETLHQLGRELLEVSLD
ncbi:MAG: DUF2442 domain-containing protein [Bacteroidia bacterium]|nr:DUF2442 domain-containing protein [Bacteroidia bacterium]